MRRLLLLTAFAATAALAKPMAFHPPAEHIVIAPVADVRADRSRHPGKYIYDEKQETQVTAGESVLVYERKGRWARIECPDQPEYTHNQRWEGYPGWVEAAALTSDLTQRAVLKAQPVGPELRDMLIHHASRHIGNPYLWGGRSLHDPSQRRPLTGVDCSGLINWSFREAGWIVPRDAHEQFLRARRLESADLQPADLIFLAKPDKPEKIVHVMFVVNAQEILEAPQSGEKVRRMSVADRFGKPLAEMKNGMTVGDRVVYFGTLIPEGK